MNGKYTREVKTALQTVKQIKTYTSVIQKKHQSKIPYGHSLMSNVI